MSKVAVLDTEKKVLAPCHPAVARRLLKEGKAAVFKRYPFTIILKRTVPDAEIKTQDYQLCVDPGSKVTGLAIVDADRNIVFAAELQHRGAAIKKGLMTRAKVFVAVVVPVTSATESRAGRTASAASPFLRTASGACGASSPTNRSKATATAKGGSHRA